MPAPHPHIPVPGPCPSDIFAPRVRFFGAGSGALGRCLPGWVAKGLSGVALTVLSTLAGCASSSESAGQQTLTQHVGQYDTPPEGIARPRTGVPPFESTGAGSSRELNSLAADQLTTLAVNTDRFTMIERAQLDQLLREQGLTGLVQPGELAQPGRVRGVDFLILGKVSNLRVKAQQAKRNFGLGNVRLPMAGSIGAFDFKKQDSTIIAECGVDLRVVETTSGRIVCAQHSDYTRTDTIGAFGIEILGANADADATLKIDEDNKGLILRLALDDALRQMLPKLDRELLAMDRQQAPAAITTPTASGQKFCTQCGTQIASTGKFCPGCGGKAE